MRLRLVIARATPATDAIAPVRRAYAAIHALAHRLAPDGRSATAVAADVVAADVHAWTTSLDASLEQTAAARAWRAHFRTMVTNFGARLYACDDHPTITRRSRARTMTWSKRSAPSAAPSAA